jgi:hypothetical protein
METQYQTDRDLLLTGGVLPTELRGRQKADALKLETQVTSSLQSMRDTMATEIQRGDATLQVLGTVVVRRIECLRERERVCVCCAHV